MVIGGRRDEKSQVCVVVRAFLYAKNLHLFYTTFFVDEFLTALSDEKILQCKCFSLTPAMVTSLY